MPPQEPWSTDRVRALSSAYWQSCALHAAVRLGVTAALAQAPASALDLAQTLLLDRRGLDILLRALEGLGLISQRDGLYVLDPGAAPALTPGHPGDMSNSILHMADMVGDWSQLADCVRLGKPVDKPFHTGPGPNPERSHFYRAMRDIARQLAQGMSGRLGLKPGMRFLDMGGGPGVWALTMAQEVPGLQAAVYDLPGAEPFFREESAHYPDARVEFIEGDYLRDQDLAGGPYDVVWLSQILHSEGPEVCRQMVAKAARATAPGGEVWVQEFVVTVPGHPFAGLFGLNMLVNTRHGQAYSRQELIDMLASAGLVDCQYLGASKEGGPAGLLKGRKPA